MSVPQTNAKRVRTLSLDTSVDFDVLFALCSVYFKKSKDGSTVLRWKEEISCKGA